MIQLYKYVKLMQISNYSWTINLLEM